MAQEHDVGNTAGGVRGLRRWLEPVALRQLAVARWCEAIVWFASFTSAWAFARFALNRHANYQSVAYDFGFFDQIIWNTSHGRWFETSFVEYNFLGQHVEPVLLIFAGVYVVGGGPETLLLIQAMFAGLAAAPLFYATRRLTGMPAVAMCLAIAYLLSPALHRALDFDLHPELLAPFLLFVGLYFLSADRPVAAVGAVTPVLLLKEDMAVVALMFGVLLWTRGWQRQGATLGGMALAWGLLTVFLVMPLIRGGGSDLNERFAYLYADTSLATVVPLAIWRGASHLAAETVPAAVAMLTSVGGVAFFSPAILLALPSAVLNGLSNHPQQASLDLQYSVASIALLMLATAIGLEHMAHQRGPVGRRLSSRAAKSWGHAAGLVVIASAATAFMLTSPYSPTTSRYGPDAAHRDVIRAALQEIPADAALSAQNTLLPHVSQREHIYEFPNVPPHAKWVIVDTTLPITQQSRAEGYDRVLGELLGWGFREVFSRDGVRVLNREVAP
jgi:uncharacterized membrane protein